jgi:Zn-dependent protease with chaperone function
MATDSIQSFADCVSQVEKNQLLGVNLVNALAWLLILVLVSASMGVALLLLVPGWILRRVLSEYHVRRIQALGATVSESQFPELHKAAAEVLARFGVMEVPRIIVISSGETNALALKFARQRVVVLLSELVEGIVESPAQLRFLLAHEFCHGALDHGWRGIFELYKPAKYRQGRELTCDCAGVVAAAQAQEARMVIRRLCVGNRLSARVNELALKLEAETIYSGFSGWLLRRHLTHPPAGVRLKNIDAFARAHAIG